MFATLRRTFLQSWSELDLEDCDVELRGITDVTDNDYDHIAQIHSLIAAAKDKSKSTPKALDKTKKRSDYKNSDYWVVNEDKVCIGSASCETAPKPHGFPIPTW